MAQRRQFIVINKIREKMREKYQFFLWIQQKYAHGLLLNSRATVEYHRIWDFIIFFFLLTTNESLLLNKLKLRN